MVSGEEMLTGSIVTFLARKCRPEAVYQALLSY